MNEDADNSFVSMDRKIRQRILILTKALNFAGWGCGLWLIFYPFPTILAVIAGMMVPVFAVLVFLHYKGAVALVESGLRPHLTTAFVLPSLGLALLMLNRFGISYDSRAIIIVLVATAVVSLIIFLASKARDIRKPKILFVAFIATFYCLGAVMATNCIFDPGVATVYPVETLEKDYSGNRPSHVLILSDWRNPDETINITVSSQLYGKVNEGDTVWIRSFPGLWGIEWYIVNST